MAVGVRLKERVAATPAETTRCGWLVGPWFDALLIANVAWPVFLLIQHSEGFGGRAGLQFWQLYYVTTPHRWITLLLVFFDREQLQSRKTAFVSVAAATVAVCLGVRLATGTLTCLLAVDYLWNAWHFSAQHHGVYRIYQRLGEPQYAAGLLFDKWAMRLFLLYVILRVAGVTWSQAELESCLQTIDWAVVILPAWLLGGDLVRTRARSPGQTMYLGSVCVLYLCLLWAAHTHRPALLLSLATASALFHSLEYLSLVGWSVRRRFSSMGSRLGWMAYLAPRWALTLGVFVLVLGAGGWLADQHWMKTWLLINVIIAFLHYAYDGMIWRHRPARNSTLMSGSTRALSAQGASV